MAYAPVNYTGDNAETDYTIGFPYVRSGYVVVELDSVPTSLWSFIVSGTKVRFDTAPGDGVQIDISRVTPLVPVVDFADGAGLPEADLDDVVLQFHHALDETIFSALVGMGKSGGHWDAINLRIQNVATAVADDEAPNFGQINVAVTAAELAQSLAETAQTDAETAETNAQSSEVDAQTAQTAAELAETNAETALLQLLGAGHPVRGLLAVRISNTQLDIGVGATSSQNLVGGERKFMELTSILVNAIDPELGSDVVGGFGNGVSRTVLTWYHVFLIRKDSDGSIGAYMDTSVTGANVPTGYTGKRFLLSIWLKDQGGGDIKNFINYDNGRVQWVNPSEEDSWSANSPSIEETLTILTPLGRQVEWLWGCRYEESFSGSRGVLLAEVGSTHTRPFISRTRLFGNNVFTNLTSQIRADHSVDSNQGSASGEIDTMGWIDVRAD